MIAYFFAGMLERHSGAPPGYIGKHRAPRLRDVAAVRMLPMPMPTRVPELARAQRS